MRILITGICGFAGSTLAQALRGARSDLEILGVDNFIRPGSELNRGKLQALGIKVLHADLRSAEDIQSLSPVDWVLDAAANPSVLAGTGGSQTSSRSLLEHNLAGTINVLEYCRIHRAGFILLSTSRVYSILPLARLEMEVRHEAFWPRAAQAWPAGVSPSGVAEEFATAAPVSLYGASKVCSEVLALEYGGVFGFPVWINRLGVLAGAGQFGRADQGIFSYWIHACRAKRPLKFIGFNGSGYQVRDCLHPRDLLEPLLQQLERTPKAGEAITNFGGGMPNSLSLRQLHNWCEARFGRQDVSGEPEIRVFDVPWIIMDAAKAEERFRWRVQTPIDTILDEIARHAEANPHWLDTTAPA